MTYWFSETVDDCVVVTLKKQNYKLRGTIIMKI